ncbi:hypothetical protein AAMO2058_001085200 [Amorphochlora amoebiformis]
MAATATGIRLIGLGWAGFIGENLILSHNRSDIIRVYGEDRYHFAYSALSTVTTASIAYGYLFRGRGQGPTRAMPGMASRSCAVVCQTLGLLGVSQFFPKAQIPITVSTSPPKDMNSSSGTPSRGSESIETPEKSGWEFKARCPFDFQHKENADDEEISGLKRITRHPALWSISFLSLAVTLRTRFISEVVMFTGPVVTTLILGNHMDYRFRRGEGGYLSPEDDEKSSFFPFYALLTGTQKWTDVIHEGKGLNATVAMCISALLYARTPSAHISRASIAFRGR